MSKSTKLSASWQLNAALLSRPVDLTALVSMSKTHPEKFGEDNVLQKLVNLLLNEKNLNKADKDTKLDVLNILANVANSYSYHNEASSTGNTPTKTGITTTSSISNKKRTHAMNKIITTNRILVRNALGGISEWFDEYITTEYNAISNIEEYEDDEEEEIEPELYKAMVLLLARVWDYNLKTEDVLELTQGNRKVALLIVIGLLQDGETYSTVLKQKQKPSEGMVGQWEHELVCHRYEKPLVLQICRLLRGFTHPTTYFNGMDGGEDPHSGEIALYSVEKFATEMDTLLTLTLSSRIVEKLSIALYDCLFDDEMLLLEEEEYEQQQGLLMDEKDSKYDAKGNMNHFGGSRVLDESDHSAIVCVHSYLQNLYFYASNNNDEFRTHMLMDTLLIPRLILPYLDRCITHASILNKRAQDFGALLGEVDDDVADSKNSDEDNIALISLHQPHLVKGLAASLRTLILATFRAPPTQYVMSLLRRLNPTTYLISKASLFLTHYDYIYSLVCCVNINMGVFDCISSSNPTEETDPLVIANAYTLLKDLVALFNKMNSNTQLKVIKRVQSSGALPISRDTPSYHTIISILYGGATSGQLEYIYKEIRQNVGDNADIDALVGNNASGRERGSSEDQGNGNGVDLGSTLGLNEHWNIRSEAKKAHNERMEAQRQALQAAGAEPKSNEQTNPNNANTDMKSEEKTSSNSSSSSQSKQTNSLLGNLPSLTKNKSEQQEAIAYALALQLPGDEDGNKKKWDFNSNTNTNEAKNTSNTNNTQVIDPTLPKEFLCAINNHVMQEPMRVISRNGVPISDGIVFEKATIEVWLQTRGGVCPITREPLMKSDLELDVELRNKIKRYHIQQTTQVRKNKVDTNNTTNNNNNSHIHGQFNLHNNFEDDDLYDF